MKWKLQYYFYFDKTKIKVDVAMYRIKEVMDIEHFIVNLVKRFN
jgi:hypothetical protein